MRIASLLVVALTACAAQTDDEGGGVPDPFASGKSDDASSLEIAWDPPRTLGVGATLPDQELVFSLRIRDPQVHSQQETVDEDGTINIDVIVESEGTLVYEVGRYFVDLERTRRLTLDVMPLDDRFEARWLIGRPGEEGLTSYEGNRVAFDNAGPGRYKVAVLTGVTPQLEGVFEYSITAR